jgi:hypothetical protein
VPYRDPKRKRAYDRDFYHGRIKPGRPVRSDPTIRSGKRALVSFRLDEAIVARIQRLRDEAVALGTYPWRSQTAWYRALIERGLKGLKDQFDNETASEASQYVEVIQQVEGIALPRKEAQSVLHKATVEIGELLGIGEEAAAAQFYHSTLSAARGMTPSTWQAWVVRELEERYPKLLEQEPAGVNIAGRREQDQKTGSGRTGKRIKLVKGGRRT